MTASRYPLLDQLNTRVRLTGLSAALGRRATLDDVPDTELDRLAETGFDWVWLAALIGAQAGAHLLAVSPFVAPDRA